MRLIDADMLLTKARTFLEKAEMNAFYSGSREVKAYWNDAMRLIKEMPTASRWIPCSERLPDYDVEVLATTEWGGITIAERLEPHTVEKDDWWFLAEGNINGEKDDVIAWMPLPEPYKGETDE